MLTWVFYALAGMGQEASSAIGTLEAMANKSDDKALKAVIADTIKAIKRRPVKGKPNLEERKLKPIKKPAGKFREQE